MLPRLASASPFGTAQRQLLAFVPGMDAPDNDYSLPSLLRRVVSLEVRDVLPRMLFFTRR